MNKLEKERMEIGNYLVNNCGAIGYKASFEDEGASSEDISRAKIVTEKVGLELNIKIGGCEAIDNIREAKILGAKAIIAPMVETPYAVKKFISAIKKVYNNEELEDIVIGINIETITGAENIEKILEIINEEKIIKRITVGRVDFIGSMDIKREEINSNLIYDHIEKIFKLAKKYNLGTAMGGGIDIKSVDFIKKLGNLLDHYETRYIIFKNDKNRTEEEMLEGMLNAQRFEANYLEDMSNRYREWSTSNFERCEMIKSRISEAEKHINNKDNIL